MTPAGVQDQAMAHISLEQAREMANECGFELRYWNGIENECFWLWYFKR